MLDDLGNSKETILAENPGSVFISEESAVFLGTGAVVGGSGMFYGYRWDILNGVVIEVHYQTPYDKNLVSTELQISKSEFGEGTQVEANNVVSCEWDVLETSKNHLSFTSIDGFALFLSCESIDLKQRRTSFENLYNLLQNNPYETGNYIPFKKGDVVECPSYRLTIKHMDYDRNSGFRFYIIGVLGKIPYYSKYCIVKTRNQQGHYNGTISHSLSLTYEYEGEYTQDYRVVKCPVFSW